jgi:predicted secreted protein
MSNEIKSDEVTGLWAEYFAMLKERRIAGTKSTEIAYVAGRADQSKLFVEQYDRRESVIADLVAAMEGLEEYYLASGQRWDAARAALKSWEEVTKQ